MITATDLFGNQHKIDVGEIQQSFRVSIYGIAVENGQALILPDRLGYSWPGGKIDKGEDHVKALKREFKEETGLDIEPVKILNMYTSIFKSGNGNYYHTLMIYYKVRIVGGQIATTGFEGDEKEHLKKAEWVDLSKIRKMKHQCTLNISDEILKLAR